MAQDRFTCEGCGKQFDNRGDLQKHEQNCSAMPNRQGQSSGRPMTHGAGGQSRES